MKATALSLAMVLALVVPVTAQEPKEVEVEGVLVHRIVFLEQPADRLSAVLTLELPLCFVGGDGVERCERLAVHCGADLVAACWQLPIGSEVEVTARVDGDRDGTPRLTVAALE